MEIWSIQNRDKALKISPICYFLGHHQSRKHQSHMNSTFNVDLAVQLSYCFVLYLAEPHREKEPIAFMLQACVLPHNSWKENPSKFFCFFLFFFPWMCLGLVQLSEEIKIKIRIRWIGIHLESNSCPNLSVFRMGPIDFRHFPRSIDNPIDWWARFLPWELQLSVIQLICKSWC